MAVPVVSTTVGAEGLTFDPTSEIIVRDDPAEWVDAITGLMKDTDLRRRIGEGARARVEESYEWTTIGHAFARELMRRSFGRDA
jgi:glycosyltransferase involved in cell wall biosynthesis